MSISLKQSYTETFGLGVDLENDTGLKTEWKKLLNKIAIPKLDDSS